MSEESEQEKTEHPTERRKQDALEKGQVLVSKDFVMAGVLLAGAGVFAFFGRQMFQELVGMFRQGMDVTPAISRDLPLLAWGPLHLSHRPDPGLLHAAHNRRSGRAVPSWRHAFHPR
jgi:hypothetical protein